MGGLSSCMPGFSATQRRRQHPNLLASQLTPTSAGQVPELKTPDPHADQPQCRMPHSRRHAAHLPVPPLPQPQLDPEILHIFSKTNRRIARWKFGLRVQKPGASWQCAFAVKENALAKRPKSRFTRKPLHKHMVVFFNMTSWREQKRIPTRFIGEQQQSFGVGVQPADGIDALRKSKLR